MKIYELPGSFFDDKPATYIGETDQKIDVGGLEKLEKIFSELLKEFDKRKSCRNADVAVYEMVIKAERYA